MSAITIKGAEYAVDYNDLAVVRELLAAHRAVSNINDEIDGKDGLVAAQTVIDFVERGKSAIHMAVGQPVIDEHYGEGSLPFREIMELITTLAKDAGPAYDAMFRDVKSANLTPS